MKIVKNFIKEKLVEVGFNAINLFDFEQLDKTQLLKNTDSAEFFDNQDSLKRNQQGQLSTIDDTETNVVTQKQLLEKPFTLNLRLLMKKESLENRLDNLDSILSTDNSPGDTIARIEQIDSITKEIRYFDIVSKTRKDGKEIQLGTIEVFLTFLCRTGISERKEILTLWDFPMEGTILENQTL